jgi:hypothetical protein
MKYKIFIQDKVYKTIEAKNTGEALSMVTKDIKKGKVSFLDKTKDSNIRIENAS